VKCIYIDPPYNTDASAILYKNDYKHSSWLTLMENRISLSSKYKTDNGVLVVAVDECEQEVLGMLLSKIFPGKKKTSVTVIHNPSGQQGDNFSYCHDFAYFIYPDIKRAIGLENREENPDIRPLRDVSKGNHLRTDAANCFYPIRVKGGEIIEIGEVCSDSFHPKSANINKRNGIIDIYPIDAKGVERKWVFSRNSVENIIDELRVEYNKSREIYDIIRTKSNFNYKTVWADKKYSSNSYGAKLLNNILGENKFSFPKSIYTVLECIKASTGEESDSIVLDYFAGSGTTGHAVINLNREDGGQRKFILIEMGDHFDNVLLPRIKKITYAPEWKDGKPRRAATPEEAARSPRLLKYQRLESYEDALENIHFKDDISTQAAMKFPDYLLRYMLDWETRQSPSLLNPAQLSTPFDYKLRIRRGGAFHETSVDLPETFNYLIGLQTKTRRTLQNGPHAYLIYTGLSEGHPTTIIWRTTKDWSPADFERDRNFLTQTALAAPPGRIYTNADSLLPHAQSLDPIFTKLLLADPS